MTKSQELIPSGSAHDIYTSLHTSFQKLIERSDTIPPVIIEHYLSFLQKAWDAQRQEAFMTDLSKAREAFAPIVKELTAGGVRKSYKYADLNIYLDSIEKPLRDHHFFITHTVEGCSDQILELRSTLIHRTGIQKETTGFYPFDKENKTAIQGYGSTMTYARRYNLNLLLNLQVAPEEDDDGKSSPAPSKHFDRNRAIYEIEKMMTEQQRDKKAMLNYYQVTDLTQMSDAQLDGLISLLRKGKAASQGQSA